MNEKVARLLFFRGVLFALRQHLKEFNTDPNGNFHMAFGEILKEAQKTIPNQEFEFLSGVQCDPIFGVYTFAIQMVLEGEADAVLLRLKHRVIFDVSAEEARLELRRLPNQEWFELLGKNFARELSRKKVTAI